jgi:hypothetical protein
VDGNSRTVGTNRVLCICEDGWLAAAEQDSDSDDNNSAGACV